MWRRGGIRLFVGSGVLAALAASAPMSAAAAADAPRPASAAELAAALAPAGRPVVVHVWATWCAPCVAEWPSLAGTLREAAGRVDVVTVALDEKSRRGTAARILAGAGGVPGRALLI